MAELEFRIEAPDKGRVLAFPSRAFLIGSSDECAVRFASEHIAAKHAEVMMDDRGQWWVRDLVGNGSISVNNTPVIDERLSPGDKLRVGDVVMSIQDSGVNQHARTRSGDAMPAVELGAPEPGVLETGTVIDSRYRILGKIAEGGMGEVYRAEHVELGKQLAMKVMLPELSRDSEFVGRFKREAIASSRIGHPNLIDISDFGQTPDGRFYFVMEFVDGKTLIKYRREGPFRFERVVHVGLQIARALAAAHAVNIIHRDLKPENIMLVQRPGQPDFVKVLDFGIAKVLGAGQSGKFTAIGAVVGTPQYMAPEQASAGVVDTRSDIYSFGLILHELVRGRPTFTGDSAVELMSRQLDTLPAALKSPWGTVPPALDRIIMQMLDKSPTQRPASMEAVIVALEAVESTPTPARTEPVTAVDLPAMPAGRQIAGLAKPTFSGPVDQTQMGALTPPDLSMPTRQLPPTGVAAPRGPDVSTQPEGIADAPGVTPRPSPAFTKTARLKRDAPQITHDSSAELAAVRPNRVPLILGLIVIVGALVGAIAWTFKGEAAKPGPAVAENPPVVPPVTPQPVGPHAVPVVAASVIKLSLESVPERVEVYEDDVLLGTTPLVISRPQSTITPLRFEARGYASQARKVRFESDTVLKVELVKDGKPTPRPNGRPRPAPGDEDLKDSPF